jgi:hypothetical protein
MGSSAFRKGAREGRPPERGDLGSKAAEYIGPMAGLHGLGMKEYSGIA